MRFKASFITKAILSMLMTLTLVFSPFLSLTRVYADDNNMQTEKILGIARIVTYTKKGDLSKHYAKINGVEKEVIINGTLDFSSLYDLSATSRQAKNYRILSVEPYNGSNFDFGANVYDYTQIFNKEAERHFFTPQTGFMTNKEQFNKKYSVYSAQNIQISSSKLTDKGVDNSFSVSLVNGLDYISNTKEMNKNNLPYLRNLFGGSNIDSDGTKMLASLEKATGDELNKMAGYVYFVPYVMNLQKIETPDIAVTDGKFTHENNQLCYEYTVTLTGDLEKVENVPVSDNNKKGETIAILEKDTPIVIKNCVPYPDGKNVVIDIFVNNNKDTPKDEKTYDNNTYKVGTEADLEVVKFILDKEYTGNKDISVPVVVKNNSEKEYITEVSLKPGDKVKPVKLAPGASEVLVFTYKLPKSGQLTFTAEINPKKSIEEKDYTNNKKSATITIKKEPTTPPKSGPCSATVSWTEVDGRWETRYYQDSKGNTRSYQVWVEYNFGYEATAKTTVTVSDDKGGQKNKVTTKSGYGIKVDTSTSISVKQTSGEWSRTPTNKPSSMGSATVTTSWKVKKIHEQGQVVNLSSNGQNKFTTAINPSSENKAKVIYTDIDQKDGKHSLVVRVGGAYVDGQELCTVTDASISIKGNMYEDYRVN